MIDERTGIQGTVSGDVPGLHNSSHVQLEGKLRTQDTEGIDWFDLRQARKCLEIVSKVI